MALATRPYTVAVVLGKDIIPRLSMASLEIARNCMLELMLMTSAPKWRLLPATALHEALCCCWLCVPSGDTDRDDPPPPDLRCNARAGRVDDAPAQPAARPTAFDRAHESESMSLVSDVAQLLEQQPQMRRLYPPGRILHLCKVSTERPAPCNRSGPPLLAPPPAGVAMVSGELGSHRASAWPRRGYTWEWIANDALDELLVSPLAILDHLPHHVDRVLRELAQQLLPSASSATAPDSDV